MGESFGIRPSPQEGLYVIKEDIVQSLPEMTQLYLDKKTWYLDVSLALSSFRRISDT